MEYVEGKVWSWRSVPLTRMHYVISSPLCITENTFLRALLECSSGSFPLSLPKQQQANPLQDSLVLCIFNPRKPFLKSSFLIFFSYVKQHNPEISQLQTIHVLRLLIIRKKSITIVERINSSVLRWRLKIRWACV